MEVVVLGMHRSGTSLTAMMLDRMGISAGDPVDLLPANPANPEGFWESGTVVEANDLLLTAAGASWVEAADFDIARIPEGARSTFRDKSHEWTRHMAAHAAWFVKDPRLCLTLPLWLPFLKAPTFVLVLRHPVAVAKSLLERDGLPLAGGLALWELYMRSALTAIRGQPVHVVVHEDIIADPDGEVRRLADFLGQRGTGIAPERRREAIEAVKPTLDHHRDNDASILTRSQSELLATLIARPATAPADIQPMTPDVRSVLRELVRLWQRSAEASGIEQRHQATRCELALAGAKLHKVREGIKALDASLGARVLERVARVLSPSSARDTSRPIPFLRSVVAGGPTSARVTAILAARNEERYLRASIEHYAAQGVDLYVIDHASTDRTREIAESFVGRGVVGVETMPHDGTTNWAEILRRKQAVAAQWESDWFIHIDADEFFLPPPPYKTLQEALTLIGDAGFNACNAAELVFVPTAEHPDHAPETFRETMRWYYPFAPTPLYRVCLWRRTDASVDVVTSGGHNITFAGRNLFPVDFLMKHYIVMNRAHATEKYGRRVYADEDRERNWHGWRNTYDNESFQLLPEAKLRRTRSDWDLDTNRPEKEHIFIRKVCTP